MLHHSLLLSTDTEYRIPYWEQTIDIFHGQHRHADGVLIRLTCGSFKGQILTLARGNALGTFGGTHL